MPAMLSFQRALGETCMYIYIYMYMYMSMSFYLYMCLSICISYVDVCVHRYVCVYRYVHIHMLSTYM